MGIPREAFFLAKSNFWSRCVHKSNALHEQNDFTASFTAVPARTGLKFDKLSSKLPPLGCPCEAVNQNMRGKNVAWALFLSYLANYLSIKSSKNDKMSINSLLYQPELSLTLPFWRWVKAGAPFSSQTLHLYYWASNSYTYFVFRVATRDSHLDGHFPPVRCLGSVHLSRTGGRDGLGVKLCEQLWRFLPKVLQEKLLNLCTDSKIKNILNQRSFVD